MQSSMFNLRVPLEARNEVFLMNTITDAQFLVSADVAALLDSATVAIIGSRSMPRRREALALLQENGFLVPSRDPDRQALDAYLPASRAIPPS